MTIGIDSSVLLSYYQARSGAATTALASTGSSTTAAAKAPTAPWATNSTALRENDLVKNALLGKAVINENAAQLDVPGASADYKKLFALYQGLNTLYGLADQANAKTASDAEKARLNSIFGKSLSTVTAYADSLKLDQLRITRGDAMLNDKTAVGVAKNDYTYTTQTLYTGTSTDPVPAFQGDVSFNISAKKVNSTVNVSIDLNEMGSTTRSMANVVTFINQKLADAGLTTRFATQRTTGEARTVTVAGKQVTLPATGDAWAMTISGDSSEALTFSAATAKPAVYLTTQAGDPDPDKDAKTNDGVIANTLMKVDPSGQGAVGSHLVTDTLEGTVTNVRQTKVGPDGSVYVLADVNGTVADQTVKGDADVALLKYDSAGNLTYARTLGASGEADGLAMSISADGKVAIAGKITGGLNGSVNGALNSGDSSDLSDSFVTLYDAKGDETWTVRRGALQDDEATAVTFGDDGTVYVGGRTKSSLPGATGVGGWDGYLTAISTDAKGAPKTLFTKQFGTTADDKVSGIAFADGQIVVAGAENGHGVVRSFDTTGAATGTRDLGDLQGGSIAGLAIENGDIYIAGNTRNGALAVGDTTRAYAGGMDGFAAKLSTDLSSQSDDALAYYGGAGDNTVTGMAVAGGQVWIVGSAGEDLPGLSKLGSKDGYLAQLDVASGAVVASERLSGKDGIATATSVAVDATGASALDKLGLPKGTMEYARSQKLVSATSLRPGDTFQLRTKEGGSLSTVTIDANDTLDTLATKISRATGFSAKVEVVSDGDVRRLKISPYNDNQTIELLPGKAGKDALESLGLAPGVVRNTKVVDGQTVSADGKGNIYGLGLDTDLDLTTADGVKNAMKVLSDAMSKIRTAYRDMVAALQPKTATSSNKSASGPVPAYLTAQLANYQAGLNRLTGGG